MKQIEYTKEQELVLSILEMFKDLAIKERYAIPRDDLLDTIKHVEKKYNIQQKYLTLREYLNKNSCGSYHRFFFTIPFFSQDIVIKDITGVSEFAQVYKEELLDSFYVIKDKRKDNGGNCENYQCNHYLVLERVE